MNGRDGEPSNSQLPPYDEWLDKIEEAIGDLEQRGHPVDKLIVDPDAFLAWGQANGRIVDHDAGNAFVAILLCRHQNDDN